MVARIAGVASHKQEYKGNNMTKTLQLLMIYHSLYKMAGYFSAMYKLL